MDFGLTERPILVFKITSFGRFPGNAGVESMRASLEVNPKLMKAFGYIGLLIKVGTAISEVSVHSKFLPTA
jgi:hypothetical protein